MSVTRSNDDRGNNYLLEQGQRHTGAQELAQVANGELAERLEDVLFNLLGIFVGVVWVISDDH